MKRIDLEKTQVDIGKFKKRTALISDVSHIITEDCIIYVKNQPVLLYKKLEIDTSALRWAVKNQKYLKGLRTRGLVSTSNIFGYSPRIAMRHDYCTITAMAKNYPKNHHVITNFASELVKYYKEYFPEQYEYHNKIVEDKVMNEWTIGGSPFTSGIVNKNNQLKYHLDFGNFKGVLSNMIVFKSDVDGGNLLVPELNIALEVADNTLTIFNGQEILHGVSPIEYKNKLAYRYSIVYYSLEQMWKCQTINDEITRIRKVKTVREKNRIEETHINSLMKSQIELKEYINKEYLVSKAKNKP